ncbi:MAG: excinuclease ABC subunit UvrC [Anaerolineae bacterium]|jgi:excinuclease ABC subunit C
MTTEDHLRAKLAGLPDKPGVYIMRDANGKVIYVGKAIVLRNRVRSYFHQTAQDVDRTRRLVGDIADLEWIVTESELEALILENELIKRHQPRYNVRLKDDKRYPYIKVSMQEDYPRIYTVRQMLDDGARYFGPFTSSHAVYQTLDVLRRLFPYRTCNRVITGQDARPCLYYHIKRCTGPCIGAISREAYRANIERACLFLEGKQEQVIAEMDQEMGQAAEALNFERAAALRDQIAAIHHVIEGQRIVSENLHDHDFVALARDEAQSCVQVFFVRSGKLIGREYFVLQGAGDEDEAEIMSSFLQQFYDGAPTVPPEVLVQTELDDLAVLQEWLRRKRGQKVLIKVPKRGGRRKLMEMAAENAVETLTRLRAEWQADTNKHVQALAELQEALSLPEPPSRIECYDISTLQGSFNTGSMVVFTQGVPSKRDYRKFRVKTVEGADDYASMVEVIERRFRRVQEEDVVSAVTGKENRWAIMPDLIILDGGKGQLNAVRAAMQRLGVDHIPTVGLAKQEEELFVPGRSESLLLPRGSQGLFLLQRIRDEAHRFTISYNRQLRQKAGVKSILDEVPGIGPTRRTALLKAFKSIEGIRRATLEELAAVPGMTRAAATAVVEHLAR